VTGLLLFPVVLSLLVLGAHFLRAGNLFMVLVALFLIGALGVRRSWVARTVQVALVLGAVEWVRTLAALAAMRSQAGEPMMRMVLILGGVALWTALSALLFQAPRLRARYGLDRAGDAA
jgi:hypothetical protein